MKQTKCLLIVPPPERGNTGFPRGLMHIASFLRQKGCPVTILPLDYFLGEQTSFSENDMVAILEDAIKESKPDLVGVSNLFTYNYPACVKILEVCKNIDKTLITVIGGPHVTFQDRICLQDFPFIDIVVRGEGEWTMLDLISALNLGRDIGAVKGISLRQNGGIIRTVDRPLGDLRELPPIDFGLLPSEYVKNVRIHGVSNRGCAYRCAYCVESVYWKKKRELPTSIILNEIMTLKNDYGKYMGGFFESMIDTESGQFLSLVTELTNNKILLPQSFYIHVRPDCITESAIVAMKKAGISNVRLGVESGSPTVRKHMGRFMTNETITESFEKLWKEDMNIHAYWIIGHPGDNPVEAQVSIDFLRYLYHKGSYFSSSFMMFLPYPGTRFFDNPEKHGVEILSLDWANWDRKGHVPPSQLTTFSAEDIYSYYRRSEEVGKLAALANFEFSDRPFFDDSEEYPVVS